MNTYNSYQKAAAGTTCDATMDAIKGRTVYGKRKGRFIVCPVDESKTTVVDRMMGGFEIRKCKQCKRTVEFDKYMEA